jgi:pyruvate,water dikinase
LRCGAGFGTERNQVLPGWREQPALVLELVQRYVPQDLDGLLQARLMATMERDRRVAELQARLADEPSRVAFTFWLTAARQQQQAFEDHNYKIDSATGALLHRAIAACARRLVMAGVLAAQDEVWWLQAHEILLVLRGLAGEAPVAAARGGESNAPKGAEDTAVGRSHWPTLIAARQAQYAWRRMLTPPPALGTLSAAPQAPASVGAATIAPRPAADPASTEGAELPTHLLVKGESGSRGVATGRVRLVSHEDLVPDLAAGDVLVAHNAGPLWTPVFPVVAAVVLDQGALLQHAMLTCREYGVPAVFQTKDATQRLYEGQRVTVDGMRGWVLAADAEYDSAEDSAALSR